MTSIGQISRSQRTQRKRLHEALERSLRSDDGKLLLRWVIDLAGIYSDAPFERRSVGLDIIAELNEVEPHGYVLLMKEGADELLRMRAAKPEEDDEDA